MKKTLLLITSLVFLTTIAFSQSKVNIKSWWSKNVKIDSSGTNDNGKRDGLYTQWYENGQKKWEGTYKDGKIVEEWTFHYDYYENGQKKEEGTYKKNGKKDGKWTSWHENGKKTIEGTYKDGKKDGLETRWYENGQKELEGTYKDGEFDGLWTGWHENGQNSWYSTYKDGEFDGLTTGWYENGQKKYEITWKNDEIISGKCWDEDGNECECGERWWEGCK